MEINRKNTWKKDEIYLDSFEYRIDKMVSLLNINKISSIMDLGCGMQTLKKKLSSNTEYIGIDQYSHIESSLIIDLNKGEFYNKKVDIIFCSGILEYMYDMNSFVKNISNNTDIVIFSYHFYDEYKNRGDLWVNSYTRNELLNIFYNYGYTNNIILTSMRLFDNYNDISNNDHVCILSKSSYDMELINFNKVNEIKARENFYNTNIMINSINNKIDLIIDSIAWLIPIKKWRDNFRNKFL